MVNRFVKGNMRTYTKDNLITSDRLMGPQIDTKKNKPILRHALIDSDGIVHPGSRVYPKQVIGCGVSGEETLKIKKKTFGLQVKNF